MLRIINFWGLKFTFEGIKTSVSDCCNNMDITFTFCTVIENKFEGNSNEFNQLKSGDKFDTFTMNADIGKCSWK